jgi:hypothetical protein
MKDVREDSRVKGGHLADPVFQPVAEFIDPNWGG